MDEYIDRNALIEHIRKDPLFDLVEQYGITGVIESFPVADVQPVKHCSNLNAAWSPLFECSICHWKSWDTYDNDTSGYNYCPNCGAKLMVKHDGT